MKSWREWFDEFDWGIIYMIVVLPFVMAMPFSRIVYIWVKDLRLCLFAGYFLGFLLVLGIIIYVYFYLKKD